MKRVRTMATNHTGKRQAANEHLTALDSLPSFEAALDELDKAVAALESGDLELDAALALFERGMRLAHVCQEALDRAELRVSVLLAADDDAGGPREVPFEQDEG